jgi:IS4 transposase
MNSHRSSALYRDLYFALLDHFCGKEKFVRNGLFNLRRKVFLLDASLITVCLSMFDWARFRRTKGAVKLHLQLDYDGCLPTFAHITDGKTHEINVARELSFPKGSVVVFDRGYLDFEWLHVLDSTGVFFVTRLKDNNEYALISDYTFNPKEGSNVLKDCQISLTGTAAAKHYHRTLRLVHVLDSTGHPMRILTNNFQWSAHTIADIYRQRWHIEVFFKHIKQNLHVKSFIRTSENAVQIQLWTALIAMLLLKVLKLKATYQWHLSNLITFIRLNLFVKIDLFAWLNKPFLKPEEIPMQPDLFSG